MKPKITIIVSGGPEAALICDTLHCLNGSQSPNNLAALADLFAQHEIATCWNQAPVFLDLTPTERLALVGYLNRLYNIDRTLRRIPGIIEKLQPQVSPPPPPLVPLGPNKTRDGREARVICIDVKSSHPVRYLVFSDGREIVRSCSKTGSHYLDGHASKHDLVGHLPPEPPEPREFWINIYSGKGRTAHLTREAADSMRGNGRVELVHVREVTPGQDEELVALRRWKREQMQVSAELDIQAIGKEIGLTLGENIGPAVLPYIRRLKNFIGALRQPAVSARVEGDAYNILGS